MQTMPKKYPAASGSPERFEVRELKAEHRVSRMSNEIVLGGCTPTPQADNLKALGVLSLLTEREPQVRGAWRGEVIVLRTEFGGEEGEGVCLTDNESTTVNGRVPDRVQGEQ